ncbi:MAG: gluconate 2-dehydrogenase subunit 3 family protein [Terriglobales bacterium]
MRRATEAMEHSRSVLAPVRAIFRAIVTTVVPEAKQLDDSGWLALETLAEDALEIRPPALRRQLRLFLRAIEWLPMVRYGHAFSALGDEQRERILRHLQDHPVERIRCGFWGLRTLALLGYYGRPEAAHAIGYRPDARGWEAVQR